MNKRLVFGFLAILLTVGIASAALLDYFGVLTTTLNVNQAVTVEGELTQNDELLGVPNEFVDGSEITMTNNVPSDVRESVNVEITDDTPEGIKTNYFGTLELTEKTVDFNADVWQIPEDAEKVHIKYTMVGDRFTADIIDGAKDGYTLIYYKDNSDRFNSPARAIGINDVEGNLPYEDDKNIDEYNYCETGEYKTCHGAKIWYIPADAIDQDGNLNWGRAQEFFYESSLIQYNSDGIIRLYPENSVGFVPRYTLNGWIGGEYTITTRINPVEE